MTSYNSAVLADSPILYYKLDETSGTPANAGSSGDTASKGAGITQNVTSFANGVVGITSAGGTTGYLSSTLSSTYFSDKVWSVEWWQKGGASSKDVGQYYGPSSGYGVTTNGTGKLVFTMFGGTTNAVLTSTTTITGSTWHHIVVTSNGNDFRLYIDGTQESSSTTSIGTFTPSTTMYILSNLTTTGAFSVDEFAFYDSTLSSTRVTAHRTAGLATDQVLDVSTLTNTADIVAPNAFGPVTTLTTAGHWTGTTDSTIVQVDSTGTTSTGNARFRVLLSSISGSTINVTSSKVWFYVTANTTVSIDLYRSVNGVVQGSVIRNLSTSGFTTNAWNSVSIAEVVQDASDNARTYVEFSLVRNSGSGSLTGYGSSVTNAHNRPYLETVYSTVTYVDVSTLTASADVVAPSVGIGATVDVTTLTASADIVETGEEDTGTAYDAATATASADIVAPNVDYGLAIDVSTLTATADTEDVTIDIVSPNAIVIVDTATATADVVTASVALNSLLDVVAATASADVDDVTVEVFSTVLADVDSPHADVTLVRLTDVNGEPIVATEDEDRYFVATMATNPYLWWRLDETSGTDVIPRVGTYHGTYNNVTIGLHDGPDSRHSVHFNGSASISEIEGSEEAINYGHGLSIGTFGIAYEFTFRTTRKTQFIMGGVDWATNIDTGLTSPLRPAELWMNNGRLEWRYFGTTNASNHFLNVETVHWTAFTDLADGEWHHVIISGGNSNFSRGQTVMEAWVDGNLEIRTSEYIGFGVPDAIGGRGPSYPDPQGPWNMDDLAPSEGFLGDMTEVVVREGNLMSDYALHRQYDTVFGYDPVYPETVTATATSHDASIKGNKPRILVIDFGTNASMSLNQTYSGVGPQPGHDAFGRLLAGPPYVAPYQFTTLTSFLEDANAEPYQVFKAFVRQYGAPRYDEVTFNERILDLERDAALINIDDYDAIAIGGYPASDADWSWYDVMDQGQFSPFVPGRKQVENLIGQIRNVVIAGKPLFINDPNSAIALGIVDRVEYVPVMREILFDDNRVGAMTGFYDERSAAINPWGVGNSPSRYKDEHANQFQRVRKIVDGLTTLPSYVITDYFEHYNTDPFGTPPYNWAIKYADRTDGLHVGDEFYMNGADGPGVIDEVDNGGSGPTVGSRVGGWIAAPMSRVKVGSVVTSFAAKVYDLDQLDENPYKDYAVNIVVETGDQWNGQTVNGKVYVNFTEAWTHWATWFEWHPHQIVPSGVETTDKQAWDFTTYRGDWTGSTVSGGTTTVVPAPDAATGSVTSTTSKVTKTPLSQSLMTFHWRGLYPIDYVEVLSMANRGLRWLVSEVEPDDGSIHIDVDTAIVTGAGVVATAAAQQSTEIGVQTVRATAETYNDADTTGPDVAILMTTATASAFVGAFIETVDLATGTVTVQAIEPDFDLLEGLELIRLILPRDSAVLYLEDIK